MSKEMERMKEIEARKEELRKELEKGVKEDRMTEIQKESADLAKEEDELRAKIQMRNDLKPKAIPEEEKRTMNEKETRAKALKETGKMEVRALLASGKIAKPTEVGGINPLASVDNTIVDDVKAVALTGNGTYRVAYKKTDATAADVTEGEKIGGTEDEFGYVDLNPATWGCLSEISNQIMDQTPLNYEAEVENSSLTALRSKAAEKIVAAVKASALAQKVTYKLDQDYLRNLVLGYDAIDGKGEAVLYISQADLATLGKVRGTNEKRPLYTIAFDAGTTKTGILSEGGLATKFRVEKRLTTGEQLYGQPQNIEMPMWNDYKIETDEGGTYFQRNMIGVRGLQTASADLCAQNGMQIVSNTEGA